MKIFIFIIFTIFVLSSPALSKTDGGIQAKFFVGELFEQGVINNDYLGDLNLLTTLLVCDQYFEHIDASYLDNASISGSLGHKIKVYYSSTYPKLSEKNINNITSLMLVFVDGVAHSFGHQNLWEQSVAVDTKNDCLALNKKGPALLKKYPKMNKEPFMEWRNFMLSVWEKTDNTYLVKSAKFFLQKVCAKNSSDSKTIYNSSAELTKDRNNYRNDLQNILSIEIQKSDLSLTSIEVNNFNTYIETFINGIDHSMSGYSSMFNSDMPYCSEVR